MTAPDPAKFHPNSGYAIPTRTLYQGAEYVPAVKTDIRARFDLVRAEQMLRAAEAQAAQWANVRPMRVAP